MSDAKVVPITPTVAVEAAKAKQLDIPDFVIAAVNECIVDKIRSHWQSFSDTNRFHLLQDDIISAITTHARRCEQFQDLSDHELRNRCFDAHWLDFEPLYELHGWKVTYIKPHYTEETDDRSFLFSRIDRVLS